MLGRYLAFTLCTLMALQSIHCGSSSSITAVINGKEISMPVDGVDIAATGIGDSLGGVPGYPIARSMAIMIRFINGGIIDQIRFDIRDTAVIIIGQTTYIDQANVLATVSLSGIDQYIAPGLAVIKFDQLGLAEGQTVSGDFQMTTPSALLSGHFEGEVRFLGY